MTKLKICGLMNEVDVRLCAACGADLIGFVTDYPIPVAWQLTREQTRALLACVPPTVKSCIVTGGRVEDILSMALELRPDYIQLHYQESLAETKYLAETLLNYGIQTIKAIPIRKDGSCEMPEFSSVADAVSALAETKVSALLLDSRCAASPTSRSRLLDTEFCREMIELSLKPLILSGSITGDNLERILRTTIPFGVDILTGSEDVPGQKNRQKIEKICRLLAENKSNPHPI